MDQPNDKIFRTKLSETVFENKYKHDGCETWRDLSYTLAKQVVSPFFPNLWKDVAEIIAQMKFIPGGRYLYYAGRPVKFFNNCFNGKTKALTSRGWRTLEEIYESGDEEYFLSPVDGKYKKAKVYCHGIQQINEIIFQPLRGRSNIKYYIYATPNHKWPLINGGFTEKLKVGDVVPANPFSVKEDDLGFAHGFVFGDGNRHGQLRLCSDKDLEHLDRLSKIAHTITYPASTDGDPVLYFNQNINWKELPYDENPEYIAGFIRGWIAADGSDGRILHSVNKEHLEWFRKYAAYAGLVISGELRYQDRDISLGDRFYSQHRIWIQNYSEGKNWQGFKVWKINKYKKEKVYCPFEPEYNRFVLENNIDTFNCYLLRAETDTREDWADISWKAESCLLTGGGIGVDYSVYRPSTATIARTGGKASGPIPKMQMINEIGRRVMQGGSRRSAIYASLNWQHGDIDKFLVAKNWHEMPVGRTGKTLWDIKQEDFDFPAPLDMTNISVNYDTKWLLNFYKTGDVGEVFLKNVEQALTTGEPGFSFNFFEKENETLRNA